MNMRGKKPPTVRELLRELQNERLQNEKLRDINRSLRYQLALRDGQRPPEYYHPLDTPGAEGVGDE